MTNPRNIEADDGLVGRREWVEEEVEAEAAEGVDEINEPLVDRACD